MSEQKPRELWVESMQYDFGVWKSVVTNDPQTTDVVLSDCVHFIEKSAYDALAERLREAEAALSDYVAEKGLRHKAQSYYAKYDGDE